MTTGAQAEKAHISKDGRTAVVSISVSFLQRGGRKQILSPPGTAPWSPAPRVDVQTDRVDIKLRIAGVTSLLGELIGNCETQQDAA